MKDRTYVNIAGTVFVLGSAGGAVACLILAQQALDNPSPWNILLVPFFTASSLMGAFITAAALSILRTR